MPDPTSGTIDYYGIRWNWGTETLEMNTGNEVWVPVPLSAGAPGGTDGQLQFNDDGEFGGAEITINGPTGEMDWLDGAVSLYPDDLGEPDHFTAYHELPWVHNPSPSANVIISENENVTQSAKALLQLDSTTKGFLPPVMTEVQRDAIATPAEGLIIYNSTSHKLNVFTTEWEEIESAA